MYYYFVGMWRTLISCLLCFVYLPVIWAQDHFDLNDDDTSRGNQEALLNKYLTSKADIDSKIEELILLAQKDDGERLTVDALHKIQIALILEKQLKEPDYVSFQLNDYAGSMIHGLNERYALDFYRKATSIIPKVSEIPPDKKFNLYTNRAGIHTRLMEYDSAVFYYRRAILEARNDSPSAEASSMNNMGVFYENTGNIDSAGFYFQKALQMLGGSEKQIVLYCAIKDNLAQLNILQGNYRSAIATFLFNDSVFYSRNQANRYLINKVRLLNAMAHEKMPGIDGILINLPGFIERNRAALNDEELLKYYGFAYDWYFDHHNRIQQDAYHKWYIDLSNSLKKKYADELDVLTSTLMNVQELSFKNELNAHLLTLEKSRLKLKTARLMIFISILSALIIIGLLIFYIRKRRLDYEIRQRIAAAELKSKEMESRLIQQELELKKHDLTNIVLHNTKVYDANQKMIERLQEITQMKNGIEQQIRSLLMELQSQNQISERSIGLQAKIESVNAEFYERLRQRFPDITKAESELCGFLRINLSSKDISILKNVEASSVKMGKNRLRKKLALDQEADLYDFIRKI